MRISDECRTIQVLWSRELLRMFKEPSRMLGVVIQPLLFWFVIGSGFNYQTFFFPGVLAMVILFSAIFSTITLIDDRTSGFLQVILVGPGSRASLVIGKVLGVVTIASLQAILFLCVAPFAGIALEQIDYGLLAIFILLGATAMAGLGFVFAWGSPSSAAYHALMSMILIPLWILSGAMFPPTVEWIKFVASINPLGWLVEGFRAALNGSFVDVEMNLLSLSIFCVVILIIGVVLCRSGSKIRISGRSY